MTTRSRLLGATMVVVLALAGPFALVTTPGVAFAQSQPQPSSEPSGGLKAGTVALNMVYVPGKAIICTAGAIGSAAVMLITFGTAYREAVRVFNEGCSGDWVLTTAQVTNHEPPPAQGN
jgi:hypothetical protein